LPTGVNTQVYDNFCRWFAPRFQLQEFTYVGLIFALGNHRQFSIFNWSDTVAIILFLSLLFVKETDEIFSTLTPEEKASIAALPEGDQQYAIVVLKNLSLPAIDSWSSARVGSVFESPEGIEINQIVASDAFIGADREIWLTGVSTKNLADGQILKTRDYIFSCVGNKTYTTAIGGTKTIMEVKLIDTDVSLTALRPIAESRGYRVWGEGGNRLGIAKFIKASKRTVTIQPIGDKKRRDIKRTTLTTFDEDWVKSQEKPKE